MVTAPTLHEVAWRSLRVRMTPDGWRVWGDTGGAITDHGAAEFHPPTESEKSRWLPPDAGRRGIAGSGRRESNPHSQLGKLMYCHCTTSAGGEPRRRV